MTTIRIIPLGLCPCGKPIGVDEAKIAVTHELPYCKKFEELDPLLFLIYVRKSHEGITH